jgi:hypothetical protein
MPNPLCNYQSSSLSLRSVFRLAFFFCLTLLNCWQRTFREARRSMALVLLSFAVATLGLLGLPATHAQVINYPSGFAGSTGQIWLVNGASPLVGSTIQLTTSGVSNAANNAWYETPVNVQAFTTTFTFTDPCSTYCGDERKSRGHSAWAQETRIALPSIQS